MAENPTTEHSQPLKIATFLPYVGSFIIFLGITRLISFYSVFGISIVNFLDFSEIITSFLDVIVLSVFVFAFSMVNAFMTRDKESLDEQEQVRQKILTESNILKRLWLHVVYCQLLLIGGGVMLFGYWIWHFFSSSITLEYILTISYFFLTAFIIIIISVEIQRKHHKNETKPVDRRFISILFYTILFASLVTYYGHAQASLIKKQKLTYGTAILLENNESIVSDSTNYYIGKTINYLFIYHERENTSDVIPISRVKQITFKRKVDKDN